MQVFAHSQNYVDKNINMFISYFERNWNSETHVCNVQDNILLSKTYVNYQSMNRFNFLQLSLQQFASQFK
jgi:hypothetical protein